MNNEKKNDVGIVLLVIALLIVVLLMGIYIVVSKVDSNKDTGNGNQNTPNTSDEQQIKQENAEFFDKYLYSFLPMASANNFKKTITNFTDEDVTNFVYFYVFNNRKEYSGNKEDEYTCDVSKEFVDELVYKYFGKKEYSLILERGRTGIRKLSDTTYQVYWFPTGWMAPESNNESIVYNGNIVTVTYKLKDDLTIGADKKGSKLEFKLTYVDGRYIVNSINYIVLEAE